jgi:hypothetical protein
LALLIVVDGTCFFCGFGGLGRDGFLRGTASLLRSLTPVSTGV